MTERFDQARYEAGDEAAETLRLVAKLPAPDGLDERVHARLRHKMAEASEPRVSFWAFWTPVRRLQFAGAAVIALAVAGSTWSMHHASASGLGPHGNSPVATPAEQGGHSAFGSAKAERVPPTIKPIKVPPAARKKPSASHLKPVVKTVPIAPTAAAGTETNP
jgi:hypothetical protein